MVAGGKSRGRGGGGGRGKAAGAGGGVAKPKPRPAPGARAGGVGAGRGRGAKGKGAQSGGEYSSAALKEKRDDLKNTLKVGDDAFVLAEPDSPWAFNVVHIKDISRDRKKVTVFWYYRPEDAPCGRKMFHGTQELFASDHVDVISMESIESICKVHTLKVYQARETVDPSYDFFARFTYHTKDHRLTPDQIRVFCMCNMPVNPDHLMICCDTCREWFHPGCVSMSEDMVRRVTAWNCPECANSVRA
ncbi:chromatin remodeling protein EBS [Pseudoscourfieldia marina]